MRDVDRPGEVPGFPTDRFDPTCGGASFKSDIYVAFSDSNRKLAVRSSATSVGNVPDVSLFYFPAMTVFNDMLYVAFQSGDYTNLLYYMTYDGANWSQPQVVPGVITDYSPAMAVWDPKGENKLYLAHSGSERTGTSHTLWYTTFDGENWTTDTQVLDVSMKTSPTMAFDNGLLYVAFQRLDGALTWRTFNGRVWSGDRGIPGVSMSGVPSMVAWSDGLSLAYRNTNEPDKNGQFCQTDNEGDGWTQPYTLLPAANQPYGYSIYPGSSPLLVPGQEGSDSWIWLVSSDPNGEPVMPD